MHQQGGNQSTGLRKGTGALLDCRTFSSVGRPHRTLGESQMPCTPNSNNHIPNDRTIKEELTTELPGPDKHVHHIEQRKVHQTILTELQKPLIKEGSGKRKIER